MFSVCREPKVTIRLHIDSVLTVKALQVSLLYIRCKYPPCLLWSQHTACWGSIVPCSHPDSCIRYTPKSAPLLPLGISSLSLERRMRCSLHRGQNIDGVKSGPYKGDCSIDVKIMVLDWDNFYTIILNPRYAHRGVDESARLCKRAYTYKF